MQQRDATARQLEGRKDRKEQEILTRQNAVGEDMFGFLWTRARGMFTSTNYSLTKGIALITS